MRDRPTCMSVHTGMSSVHRGQNRFLDPQELELQVFVSRRVAPLQEQPVPFSRFSRLCLQLL